MQKYRFGGCLLNQKIDNIINGNIHFQRLSGKSKIQIIIISSFTVLKKNFLQRHTLAQWAFTFDSEFKNIIVWNQKK